MGGGQGELIKQAAQLPSLPEGNNYPCTAIDRPGNICRRSNKAIIGINRLITIIQELAEEIKPAKLAKTAKRYKKTADIQRLGYLIDKKLGFDKQARSLYRVLKERNYFAVPLSVIKKTSTSEANHKWKIIKNIELESDL